MADVMIFFFHPFPQIETLMHVYIQLPWLLVKSDYWIPAATISEKKKKKSTAKTLTLNYFTPKVFRVAHHDKLKFRLQKFNV